MFLHFLKEGTRTDFESQFKNESPTRVVLEDLYDIKSIFFDINL